MTRLLRRALLIALVLVVLPGLAPTRAAAVTRTMVQHVAIPSYIPPTSTDWNPLTVSGSGVSLIIANVANGPGDAVSADWRDNVITKVAATGTRVLGYVPTGYIGQSTPAHTTYAGETTVQAWLVQSMQLVERWYAFYGSSMGGIFFDEGMNTCGPTPTSTEYSDAYEQLKDFVKARHPGATVVLNPGIAVPECYEASADILVTFEGSYATLQNPPAEYQTLPWQEAQDPNKFWSIVYDVPAASVSDAMARTRANNAGYVYVTSDVLANPYDTLSASMLAAQVADAANVTPQTAPDVTGFSTVDVYESGMDLTWNSTPRSLVAGYDILLDGTWFASTSNDYPSQSVASIDGLLPHTTHTVSVVARTWSGTKGTASTLTRTTGWAGPPAATPVLSATTVLPNSVVLGWTAGTGIASYDLYTGGVLQATVAGTQTSARLQLLSPGQTYSFTVRARTVDAGLSPLSTAVVVTTPTPPPIAAPSGTLTAGVLTLQVRYQVAFASHHAFINDGSQGTNGYAVSYNGVFFYASYMFEEGVLWHHNSGGGWSWTQVTDPAITVTVLGDGTYTWSAPFAPAGATTVLFQGSGGGSTETFLGPITVV